MLDIQLDTDAILDVNPQTAAEFCDKNLDVDKLVSCLETGDPFTRRGLCDFLDIGESTLSGWIKEGRVPRMAKNAIVLLAVQQRLARQLNVVINYPKVIRRGEQFDVVELREDEEGEITGRVIATQIETIEDARLLASGRRALRVLQGIHDSGVFSYAQEMSENQSFLRGVNSAEKEIEALELFVGDHAAWKEKFGKLGKKVARERLYKEFSDAVDADSARPKKTGKKTSRGAQ